MIEPATQPAALRPRRLCGRLVRWGQNDQATRRDDAGLQPTLKDGRTQPPAPDEGDDRGVNGLGHESLGPILTDPALANASIRSRTLK